jgi:DNA/RNA-binding domain of Phe-tRNA-synthetase-like protein
MKPIIGYDPEIPVRFPQLSWACILIEDVSNEPSPMALTAKMRLAELEVRAALQSTPIAEIPAVVAWRRVFSSFGAKPTKYRNSLEALLRRILKGEALPSISYIVDLGNLVSLSCRVPLGIFDVDRFAAPARIGFATGDEHFADLGSSETDHPEVGEVVFTDADGELMTRRWCWRQDRRFASQPQTQRVIVIAEAHHDEGPQDVAAAVRLFADLVGKFSPEVRVTQLLTPILDEKSVD